MSRSGYNEDFGDDEGYPLALYRGTVDRAAKGKRGQKFFRDLVVALDAMPEKRLIKNEFVEGGAVCALGALAAHRGVDVSGFDPDDHYHHAPLGSRFDVTWQLIAEVEYMNDEGCYSGREKPEQRWQRMRDWAAANLIPNEGGV